MPEKTVSTQRYRTNTRVLPFFPFDKCVYQTINSSMWLIVINPNGTLYLSGTGNGMYRTSRKTGTLAGTVFKTLKYSEVFWLCLLMNFVFLFWF